MQPFVIDEIKACIARRGQGVTSRVREYAVEYARACAEANSRLEKTRLFLNSGHRTQAIRFATADPPLQKVVVQLSLDGLADHWDSITSQYQLPPFQRLKTDVLYDIEAAFAQDNTVEHLLSKYREMNLAQVSLRNRLKVLRELAIRDPTNPHWLEDIHTFERALMMELTQRAKRAVEQNDIDELESVVEQHDQVDWISELSSSYRILLKQIVPIIYSRRRIPKLTVKLEAALENEDLGQVRTLLSKLKEHVHKAMLYDASFELSPDIAALKQRGEQLLAKTLDQEKRQQFDRDVKLLQMKLDGQFRDDQIMEARRQAESHGYPLPAKVRAQFDAYFSNRRDTEILKKIAFHSVVALAIILFALGILLTVRLMLF